MHTAFRLVRLGNTLVSFTGTVVGGLAAFGSGIELPAATWTALVLAGLSTSCVTAGGNVVNDLIDRESDRVNHPDRPLVIGAVTVTQARATAAALLVASGALVVPVAVRTPAVALILAVALAALLSYEFLLKSRGFGGNLLVAFLTGAVFLYGGAAVGSLLPVVPFALMAFFATLSREVIKDMEDVAGDIDRRTLPRTRGPETAAAVARSAVAVAILLSVTPLLFVLPLVSLAGLMYGVFVAAADALFVLSVAWLPRRLHAEQSLSKGAMAVALLAFLAVAFR